MQYKIFLLLLNTITLFGQAKYYEQSYAWDYVHDFQKIVTTDSNIILMGRHVTTEQIIQGHIIQADYSGVNDTLLIFDNQFGDIGFYDIVKTNNGYTITGGMTSNIDGFLTSLLLHTDQFGNEIARYNIGDTSSVNQSYCRAIHKTLDNNNFIITGTFQNEFGYTHLYAKKVSYDGEIIWEQVYDDYPLANWFTDIVNIPGNEDFYAIGTAGYSVAFGEIIIAKISNETGDMLEEHIFDFGDIDVGGAMIACQEGGYLATGAKDGVGPFWKGTVFKFDDDFSIDWLNDSLFRNCSAATIDELPDGSIITSGCSYNFGSTSTNMLVYKLTSEGEVMWFREYGGAYNDYSYDIALSPDGGFIVAGRQDTIDSAAAWVLKLNCMGLLTEPQASFTHTLEGLELYLQNTSQYVYPDSTDGGYFVWDFGDNTPPYTQTTTSEAPIAHTYQNAGIYTITLTAIVCNDTSTYTQEVAVYTVGVTENDGFIDEGTIIVETLRATSQTLHYQLPPNQTHGNLLVYNLSGQLMDNIPIGATQGQIPINTTQWPAGLYLLQLRGAGGQHLGSAKLVVE